jgi:hypothetical protein
MAGSGNAGGRQPKFLFLMIFDAAILTYVLRHSGVKIEAYFVAQAVKINIA